MRQSETQRRLDAILARHGVQPVGSGYIDCICPPEEAKAFLEEVQSAGISVSDYSLWQYVPSPEETGRGMGGPCCRYWAGWYSEMGVLRPWQGVAELETFFNTAKERLQCALSPGFWLTVPEPWQYLP